MQLAAAAGSARQEHTVLFLLEDAQWIDPTSRELLEYALDRIQSLSVLMLITYRPEFHPPGIGQPHVTVLTLSRLGRRDGLAMIEHVAAGKAIPPELLQQIAERTDGVPLFLEELTMTVLESGVLREDAGRYVLAAPAGELAVPANLQASFSLGSKMSTYLKTN